MKFIENPSKTQWSELVTRPTSTLGEIEDTVAGIFQEILENGDAAVKKYTHFFDQVDLQELQVSAEEIAAASNQVSEELKAAIAVAKDNITAFHQAQKAAPISVETMPGVNCWQEARPIEKVGLYVPGGTAPLFSSVLMLAIPAQIAGCSQVVLCTPPNKEGQIDPAILYAASICGITQVYKVGGIQAVGAMTFGTDTIPAVYKILGPGNQFVTVAKQMATKYGVSIDMPAGPSELLVYADDSAQAEFVAADLLSQAEHGSDSQVVLVTNTKDFATSVMKQMETQLEQLPRKAMATVALKHARAVSFDDRQTAVEFINAYAPEHLIISSSEEAFFTENLMNAGSVFLGNYTPESAGDYASGTNHTLPTQGYSRQYSGVNLASFTKQITFQKISEAGLQSLGPSIEIMAEAEGLQAHKNAVSIRLNSLNA